MTTTVRVLVEGNKACMVQVVDSNHQPIDSDGRLVKPGAYTTLTIHGEQSLTVKETGDFL